MSLVTIKWKEDYHMNILVRFELLKRFRWKVAFMPCSVLNDGLHRNLFNHKLFFRELELGENKFRRGGCNL